MESFKSYVLKMISMRKFNVISIYTHNLVDDLRYG